MIGICHSKDLEVEDGRSTSPSTTKWSGKRPRLPRPGVPFRTQNQAPAGEDGRRWLQPPFPGISGKGETISGGFNRRLTPMPVSGEKAVNATSGGCGGPTTVCYAGD